jgi:hypothetical protein
MVQGTTNSWWLAHPYIGCSVTRQSDTTASAKCGMPVRPATTTVHSSPAVACHDSRAFESPRAQHVATSSVQTTAEAAEVVGAVEARTFPRTSK